MKIFWAGAALVLLTGSALADDLPGDIQHYINRRESCNYWTTEHGGDSRRREEIARQLRALRCETIDHDAAVMRARYAGNGPVQQAIEQAHDAFPGN